MLLIQAKLARTVDSDPAQKCRSPWGEVLLEKTDDTKHCANHASVCSQPFNTKLSCMTSL